MERPTAIDLDRDCWCGLPCIGVGSVMWFRPKYRRYCEKHSRIEYQKDVLDDE